MSASEIPEREEQPVPPLPRPPSAHSTHSSQSGSSSSKHVKCIGRYVLTGHTLGKGNFARVEAAVHTLTRAKVAIKVIETDKIKEEYVRKNLLREAQLMRRLRHPNIIRLYETMKTNNLYCLVTEIAEGGELLVYVRNDFKERKLPEATTRPFIRQLTSALFYLHSNGVVHRDLKMENILLDKRKRSIKIVDFGLSNSQKPGMLLQTHCGSPEYAAPELFIPGRQYGPEVDVWSLGVNMYAMLVGKLPFRSPRQGAKKRQKLLEQISAGISENHEREMAHLSTGAKDLICHLLQPDPTKRAVLDEVMHHPWITKDGTHPLIPYEYVPPDPITQNMVMDLMQKVLGEPIGQIKETVRRDRCDWLASIYNLLMDQPEGRNVLQRMLTDDPTDRMMSSAEDYGSTMEHLSLSQGFNQSHQVQDNSQDVGDSTGILTKPSFQKHDRRRLPENPESGYYEGTGVLPPSKGERRRHMTADQRNLRGYHPMHHQQSSGHAHSGSSSHRKMSVEFTHRHSPSHQEPLKRTVRGMSEEPYNHSQYAHPYSTPQQETGRPHSRMSAPEPLPLPFQRTIVPRSQLHSCTPPSDSPPSSTKPQSDLYSGSKELQHPHSAKGSAKRQSNSGVLKPAMMRKTLSASMDTVDPGLYGSGIPWKGKAQVAPLHRRASMEGAIPPIGWSSQTQFTGQQRSSSRHGITDMQPLILTNGDIIVDKDHHTHTPPSHTSIRSSDNIDLRQDTYLVGQRGSPSRQPIAEGLIIDTTLSEDGQISTKKSASVRTSSAKHSQHPPIAHLNSQYSEMSISAKNLSTGALNGLSELPGIDTQPIKPGEKVSPSWRRKSFGLIGKAFKLKNGNMKGDREPLPNAEM